jgi:acetyl esterase
MTVSPLVRQLIDHMEANFPVLDPTVSGTEMRRRLAEVSGAAIPANPEPVDGARDDEVPGPAGPIPVRVYRPLGSGTRPLPQVMFFHGGGWVLCDLDSHDGICRALTNASGCAVVAVDYRLAPEHRFPVGLEDCYAATVWCQEHPSLANATPGPLAVVGDSAGGNLAAAVALLARDRRGPSIAAEVLVYPVTDFSDATPSHRNAGEGYFLKSPEVMYYWGEYLNDPEEGSNPYASPLRAPDHRGLPPTLIITAENDPLRDEGEAYGAALAAAGVETTVSRYDGQFHSFLSFLAVLDDARTAMAEIAQALCRALGVAAPSAG